MTDQRQEALALRDSGLSVDQIAERFSVHPATVYRWFEKARDGEGPQERAIRAWILKQWPNPTEYEDALAKLLIGFAITADVGAASKVGVAMSAGVASRKELKVMLLELGQASGAEDLIKALREG